MIEVRNLTKVYKKTVAVSDLSFTVQPGVVTGFLGPNGSGKSTTMRLILGLDRPTSGTATVFGKPYGALMNPLQQVGALLDANWVHPNRSARSHLRWIATANRLPKERVDAMLELVGLGPVASKRVGQFSLGMRQRLGIAAAIMGDPQVLLFDEPINGLDPEGILWIRNLMRGFAADGRTVLVSSHMLAEIAQTADRLVVIGRGKLIADQSTAEFISGAVKPAIRVRSPRVTELAELLRSKLQASVETRAGASDLIWVSGPTIEAIGDAAGAAAIPVYEITPESGSLEQAFFEITGHSTEFAAGVIPGSQPSTAAPSAATAPHSDPASSAHHEGK